MVDGLARELADVDPLPCDWKLAALEPARDQHLLGDLVRRTAWVGDDLEQLPPVLRRNVQVLAQQSLRGSVDAGHGRPQLV